MSRQVKLSRGGKGESQRVVLEKLLTFVLGGETYGIRILKVQEIIGMAPVTRVPCRPECMLGVINLRGTIVPVVDLRRKFTLPVHAETPETCIVVLQLLGRRGPTVLGVLVEQLPEVVSIDPSSLQPPPEFGAGLDTAFLQGMVRVGGAVVLVLDIDRVLSRRELGGGEGCADGDPGTGC